MLPGQRRVSVFTETRFGRTEDGRWAAADTSGARESWSAYLAAGATVTLVGRADPAGGPNAVALDPALGLHPLPYYLGIGGFARAAWPLFREIRRSVREADLIVLRLPGAVGSTAALVCKLTGREYVADVLGDPADVAAKGALGDRARRAVPLLAAQMRWLVRGARASRYVTREALQARYPAKPGTSSTGISDVRITPEALARVARTRREGRLHVALIGTQETTYKGHDVLFAAMAALRAEGIPVTASLIGGGRLEWANKELAAGLNLAEHTSFEGNVASRDAVIAHLDSADVFVLPSRTEGLPRALVEAMARALPAVATDVGGNRELLDPEFIIDVDDHVALADRLRRLWSDAELWQRQSARNLAVARTYSAERLDADFKAWFAGLPGQRGVEVPR
ncbi:MAG TPA: glycosyltransferase [Sporichthyaceae bacterium]|nr:glycosyltransferase [Sporichthyaceae bacterium]